MQIDGGMRRNKKFLIAAYCVPFQGGEGGAGLNRGSGSGQRATTRTKDSFKDGIPTTAQNGSCPGLYRLDAVVVSVDG